MCPSADRTDNVTDNALVYLMSNIHPQAPDNNEVFGPILKLFRTLGNPATNC